MTNPRPSPLTDRTREPERAPEPVNETALELEPVNETALVLEPVNETALVLEPALETTRAFELLASRVLEPALPMQPRSVRARTPWFSLVGIVLLALLTLGNAAANMVPFHVPTARELQQQEQRAIADARRVEVDALIAEGDKCRPHIAHDIARGLVYVGRSARAYSIDYQQRCGIDPIVERWGNAPMPRKPRPI
jgi:hypothetical protein